MRILTILKQLPYITINGCWIIALSYIKPLIFLKSSKKERNFKRLVLCTAKGKGTILSVKNNEYYGNLILENNRFNFILRDENYSDVGILYEFVNQNEYTPLLKILGERHSSEEVLNFVDAGGNIGLFSIVAMQTYPNSKIAYIEPDKAGCKHFKKLLAINKLPDPFIFNNGLADASDEHILLQHGPRGNENASFVTSRYTQPTGLVTVNLLKVLEVTNFEKISVLKIDIEGAEEDVIMGHNFSQELASRIEIIAIEIHDEQVNRENIEFKLLSHGFDKVISDRVDVYINKNYYLN